MNASHPDTVERWDYLEITQKVLGSTAPGARRS